MNCARRKLANSRSERGFVLLSVVLGITLIALVAFMLGNQTTVQVAVAAGELQRDELRYVAEAGFAHAQWQLAQNTTCTGYANLANTNFGNNSYSATMSPDSGSPISVSSIATLADGTSMSVGRDSVKVYEASSVAALQPGAEGVDAEIWAQAPNNNYGSSAETWVSSASNDTTRSLLRFKTDGIPSHAKVLAATLSLQRQSGSGSNQLVSAHRINNQWDESSVTWNSRESGTTWNTAGGDFDSVPLSTTSVGPGNQRYEWSITPLVQDWVSGRQPNHGIALIAAKAGQSGERFYTSDESNSDRRPTLSVIYACECGQPCAPSIMNGNLLFVVADPSAIDGEDIARQNLIESWGYSVTPIDDSKQAADFDNAAISHDVIYVSELVDHNELGNKLRNTDIGIVVEEQYLFQEFGFSGSRSQKSHPDINVLDNTHHITSEFPLGMVDIYTTAQMSSMVINPAASVNVLAELKNTGPDWDPTVVTIDTGGEMYGGGPAPARRVKLPFTDIDVGLLSDDGRTLMRRAIEWAAESGSLSDPLAYWKLDETTGAVAVDSVGEHDGTLVNGPTWISEGQLNGALDFDESDDYVKVADFEFGSDFTVSFSLKVDDNNGSLFQYIYSHGDINSVNSLNIFLNESTHGTDPNMLRTVVRDADDSLSNTALEFDVSSIIGDGSWHTYTLTVESGVGATVYLDGVQRNSDASGGGEFDPATDIFLGARQDLNVDRLYGGSLDEVFIDDRALSAVEIANRYAESIPGPIAHWKLDETSGLVAVDSVGGHDGGLISGPTWTSSGQIDGALQFDGANDYVEVPHDDALSLTSELTITAWVRNDSASISDSYRIVSKEPFGANDSYWLSFQGRKLWFGVAGDFFSPGTSFDPNQWYHIAVSFDDGADEVVIFVDGVEVLRQATFGTINPNNASLLIGNNWENFKYWDGLLDDVRLYDRALSPVEVSAIAGGPIGGGGGGGSGGACTSTYADDFETADYSGNSGTEKWSIDWTEFGDDGSAAGGDEIVQQFDGNWELRVRDNDGGGEGVYREADTSGAKEITLTLDYWRSSLDSSSDYVALEVSSNGGADWKEVDRFEGPAVDDGAYISVVNDISEFVSSNLQIRLITSPTMGNRDEVYFDNIEICVVE